jgi:hypothetical protein
MTAGLIQLYSYGYEDKPLIYNPEITFFKIVYKKYSLFAFEELNMKLENNIHFGSSSLFKIKNYGDLIFSPILQVDLPSITVNYNNDIETEITNRKKDIISNYNINIFSTKFESINASLYGYIIPVYINDNLIINSSYDNITIKNTISKNKSIILDNNLSNIYDNNNNIINYNNFYNIFYSLYDKNIYHKNIFYSSYNINYLTYILNYLLKNSPKFLSNNLIINDNNIFDTFYNNLYNNITLLDDNKFIISLLDNNNIKKFNYDIYNIIYNIPTSIIYSLQYIYSNSNLLFIYIENNGKVKLNNIYKIINFQYSNNQYYNNVEQYINQYDIFEYDISNNKQLYISDNHYTNNIKYSLILQSDINKNGYIINFNIMDLGYNNDIKDNTLFFIYKNNKFIDIKYDIPICILKYNITLSDISNNKLFFEKINLNNNLETNILNNIYIYNDILVKNTNTEKVEFIIINNYIYQTTDLEPDNITIKKYNDDLNIYYSGINSPTLINNNYVETNNNFIETNNKSLYIYNDSNSKLNIINNSLSNINNENIYTTQEILYSCKFYYYIDNDDKRLNPIINNTIKTLNLDTYTNLNYIISKNDNITNDEIKINLQNTVNNNLNYIINYFKNFLNDNIFFKLYNAYQNNLIIYYDSYIIENFTQFLNNNIILNSNIKNSIIYDTLLNGIKTIKTLFLNEFENLLYNINLLDKKYLFNRLLINISTPFIIINNIIIQINNGDNLQLILKNNNNIINSINIQQNFNYSNNHLSIFSNNDSLTNQLFTFMFLLNNNNNNNNYNIDIIINNNTLNFQLNDISLNYIYDNINNSTHYINQQYINISNIEFKNIDIGLITYDYMNTLYLSFHDLIYQNINKNINNSEFDNMDTLNDFINYIDKNMFLNLWYLRNTLNNNNNNNNNNNIETNICISTLYDHIMINNTINNIINKYLDDNLRILIINILINNIHYLNFFNESDKYIFTREYLDNITFIDLIEWYFIFLNCIYSNSQGYIINYNYDLIFTQFTLSDFKNIKIFFDNTDIINNNFIKITNDDWIKIKEINNKLYDIIKYIILIFNNIQLKLLDNTLVKYIYTGLDFTNIINVKNINFNTLNISYILKDIFNLYSTQIFNNYKYIDLLKFYNNIKNIYLQQYNILYNNIENISYSIYNNLHKIVQYFNFDFNDYPLDNLIINTNYNNNNNNYYQFNILNYDTNYFEYLIEIYNNNNNIFLDNYKLLNIKDVNIDEIINYFNKFFNLNLTLYSNFFLYNPIYFNMFSGYKILNNNYIIYQNSNDNIIYYINDNQIFDTNYNNVYYINNNNIYDYSENIIFNIDNEYNYIYDLTGNIIYNIKIDNDNINLLTLDLTNNSLNSNGIYRYSTLNNTQNQIYIFTNNVIITCINNIKFVKYIMSNNMVYDPMNMNNMNMDMVNYYYDYNKDIINLYKYNIFRYYILINNNICNINQDIIYYIDNNNIYKTLTYTIINDNIYDLTNNIIMYIYNDNNDNIIYNINQQQKYYINNDKITDLSNNLLYYIEHSNIYDLLFNNIYNIVDSNSVDLTILNNIYILNSNISDTFIIDSSYNIIYYIQENNIYSIDITIYQYYDIPLQYNLLINSTNYIFNNGLENEYNGYNLLYDKNNNLLYNRNNNIIYDIIDNRVYKLIDNLIYEYDNNNNNNNIKDKLGDIIYKIKDNNIYDIKNNYIGYIKNNKFYKINIKVGYINNIFFTINEIEYIYMMDMKQKQIIYPNYFKINLINNEFNILDEKCYLELNCFYDIKNYNVVYKMNFSRITEIDISNNSYIKIENEYNNKIYYIEPYILRDNYVTTNSKKYLNILNNGYNINDYYRTIEYLNHYIYKTFNEFQYSTIFLLLKIMANSLLSPSVYNKDFYITSSFNNYIYDKDINTDNINNINNIDKIIEYLINYNNTNINKIVIFNITDQKFNNIDQINNLGKNKKFIFISQYYIYAPINNNLSILKEQNNIENVLYNNTLNTEYILKMKKKLINIDNIDNNNIFEYINEINKDTKEIIKQMIDNIIQDINNGTITKSLYYQDYEFNISGRIYYLYNNTSIKKEENDILFDIKLEYNNNIYTIQYINTIFYLITDNIKYIIYTTDNIINDIINDDDILYDISYNNYYYKFDNINNTVLINTSKTINNEKQFPQTLFIFNGKIRRYSNLPFGFEFDISGNINYNFKYDLNFYILSREINRIRIQINKNIMDNNFKYYINETNNVTILNNINNDIYNDITFIKIKIIDTIKSDIHKGDYIILTDGINKYYCNIIDIQDNIYIIKLVNNNDQFIKTDNNYYILRGIKNLLYNIDNYTEYLNNNIVIYYYRTFLDCINEINEIIKNNNDKLYNNKLFTTQEYIEYIFDNIYELFNNQISILIGIPDIIFRSSNTINIENYDYNILLMEYNNNIKQFNQYKPIIEDMIEIINRDKIPKIAWINYIGNFMIDTIEFCINDNTIEKLNGHIIHNYNYYNTKESKHKSLDIMIGNTIEMTKKQQTINKRRLYIPIPFFFQKNEKALPLVALIYSQLYINIKLLELEKLIKIPKNCNIKLNNKLQIELISTFVFLNNDERKLFAELRHEYLIELKTWYHFPTNNNINNLKLNLYLPIKDFIWFYLDKKIIDNKDYWNYTGLSFNEYYINNITQNDYNNNYNNDDDVVSFIKSLLQSNQNIKNHYNKINGLELVDYINMDPLPINILNESQIEKLKIYLINRPLNKNPFIQTKLQFNGHYRFIVDDIMSSLVYPLFNYNHYFKNGINVYNFGLYPNDVQHSGSLNFKLVNNIFLNCQLNLTNPNGSIYLITRSYNILRIASGFGACAW